MLRTCDVCNGPFDVLFKARDRHLERSMDVLVTVTVRACATCKELLESKRRKKDADKERLALYKWRVEVKLRAIKASARARNRKLSRQTPLLFDDASKALFIEQLNSHCWFCGYKPARPCKANGWLTARLGLDRILSWAHYIAGNTLACCTACNILKGVKEIEAFLHETAIAAVNQRKNLLDAMEKVSQEELNIAFRTKKVEDLDGRIGKAVRRHALRGFIAKHLNFLVTTDPAAVAAPATEAAQ